MTGPITSIRQALTGRHSRFVLMIGDDGAILVYIEKGTVHRRLFAPSADRQHTKTFIDLMEEYPYVPVYALVDVMDQSYVRHTFPPVTSLGLSKIVQRRLERDFAKDDIKGALNLGRESKGRKDWNFLLISLAYTKELQNWLDLVVDLPNRFAGVYLVPVECENVIKGLDHSVHSERLESENDGPKEKSKGRFSLKSGTSPKPAGQTSFPLKKNKQAPSATLPRWQILVSHNKVGGYRQVVLRDGKIAFTRMTQAFEGSSELLAGNVEQELQNTIEYLKRLGYNEQSPLDIYLIVAQEVKNNISHERFGGKLLHILTPYEAAQLLNLKQAALSGDRFGDMVIASSFGMTKKPRLKLSTPYAARLDKLYLAKSVLRSAVALLLLGMIGFTTYDASRLPGLFGDESDLNAKRSRLEKNLTGFQKAALDLHADADQVNDLVSLNGLIAAPSPSPLDLVKRLLPLIDDNHLLKDIVWRTVNPAGPVFHEKGVAIPVAAASGTASTEALPTTATLVMSIVYHQGAWDAFVKGNDDYFATIQKSFSDYKLTHTDLPGQSKDTDNLSVNFDEEAAREKNSKQGQSYDVTLTLAGPSKPAGAAPASVAPNGAAP